MWSYETLDLPDGSRARIEYDLTESGKWCAVLTAPGIRVTAIGETQAEVKRALLEKLGRVVG